MVYAGKITGIEPDVVYRATLINPATGDERDLGTVLPNEQGTWEWPIGNGEWRVMPIFQDWVLVLDARN